MTKVKLRLQKFYVCVDGSATMLVQKLSFWRPKRWLLGYYFRDVDGFYRTKNGKIRYGFLRSEIMNRGTSPKDIDLDELIYQRTLYRHPEH